MLIKKMYLPCIMKVFTFMALSGFFSAYASPLDFKTCVQTALSQSPETEASLARLTQAESALSKVKSSRLPQITLSVTGSQSDSAQNVFGMKLQQRQATIGDFGMAETGAFLPGGSPNADYIPDSLNKPKTHTNFNTRIELRLPIWHGGKFTYYENQAQAMIAAAKNGDEAVKQMLTFNIYQAYEAVHASRAYISVALKAKEAADSYVETAKNLVEEGVVVRSELLSAQVNQSSTKVALTKAYAEEKTALQTLKMLMNVSPDLQLEVAERVDLKLPARNESELLTMALGMNPSLDARRKVAQASGYKVEVAKADYYPSFNMMLRKDWHDESISLENGAYTIAGAMTWKLTDFGVRKNEVNMASAQALHEQAKAKSYENQIRIKVLSAWNRLQAAEQQLVSNELAIEQADEARRLVQKRYLNGISTITELLAANAQLDKAQADFVAARYQVNIQKAELLLATGYMDINRL